MNTRDGMGLVRRFAGDEPSDLFARQPGHLTISYQIRSIVVRLTLSTG